MTNRIKCAVGGSQHEPIQAPQWVYGDGVQRIPFTADAAPSAVFTSPLIRLYATADCLINIGDNPTAADDGTSFPLGEKSSWVECVTEGQKLSVVSASTDGVLYIIEAEKDGGAP